MKNYLLIVLMLLSIGIKAQNDSKVIFQKNKYDLAVSYLKKSDFVNALDQFSIASRIKPENEIGQESLKKVDTLKEILRKDILEKVNGTWLFTGDKPIWAVNVEHEFKEKKIDKLVEVSGNQISFYEQNRKTKEKKLIKTEDIVYYNSDPSDALYSAIILSNGTIWNCTLDETKSMLRAINIAKKSEKGVKKIYENNNEAFYKKAL
ncbi:MULTISPECIES: hypothetical protein [Flavobacterium]|uniref:Tetratricopeptide repeat protein n=1 Tax=Flavobacterium endoglycinae TaxID=2816357 RepID=A0ABX7QB96_9FLAO|nr:MULTISPECIES: hypothetical protein [Flavobacterium]QSW87944.1 hypothetical protein J0383_16910 [Flavobacterium endoglycinae]